MRSVLGVGCADGVLRAALAASVHVVGLDRSAEMLRAHPAPVVRADAVAVPFRDGTFDVVAAVNVLYHLPDPLPALREARRVLRRGGYLLTATIPRANSPRVRPLLAPPDDRFRLGGRTRPSGSTCWPSGTGRRRRPRRPHPADPAAVTKRGALVVARR